MIVKFNQDMLDNDANLQEANEDIVDEKIPKTKDHPNLEMTQTEPSIGKGEIETTEDEKGENSDSEDFNLDGTYLYAKTFCNFVGTPHKYFD